MFPISLCGANKGFHYCLHEEFTKGALNPKTAQTCRQSGWNVAKQLIK
jgi:hypothetical protein